MSKGGQKVKLMLLFYVVISVSVSVTLQFISDVCGASVCNDKQGSLLNESSAG